MSMDSIHIVILWGTSLCALADLTWITGSLFFIALNNLYNMLPIECKIENFCLGIYIPHYLSMAIGSLLFIIVAYQVYIPFKQEGEVMKKLLEEKIAKLDGK